MKHQVIEAMPPCFESWCQKFDSLFTRRSQKKGFRTYLAGLFGDAHRKNLAQITQGTVDGSYNQIRHFLNESPWSELAMNEERLDIMMSRRQTKIGKNCTMILDDSGHRKSGHETDGVGRQYIGEIGKTDQGMSMVTTHLYDGIRNIPLDVEIYFSAESLEGGKENPEFIKKPDLALLLIDRCLNRGIKPANIVMDAGYGNNNKLLKQLEERGLRYVVSISSDRVVKYGASNEHESDKYSVSELAALPDTKWSEISLSEDEKKPIWVAQKLVYVPRLGWRTLAIRINASSWEEATDVYYFLTNADPKTVNSEWVVKTYAIRNWIEVFYREVKGWLGWKEYQVRSEKSIRRHLILVFVAYTFIRWHLLTGGFQRQWATKKLKTWVDALEAFKTGVMSRFLLWWRDHEDVFASHIASLGYILA
jgi:SRSO17 transposase